MIKFEILKSPDSSVESEFRYFKNQLYIGKDGDLQIDDSFLKNVHFMLEVVGTDLLAHPHPEMDYYLINGKRATSVRKLKKNDELTFCGTSLRIQDFSETVRESKKDILNRKLNKLIEDDSSRLVVIERLTNLMKQ